MISIRPPLPEETRTLSYIACAATAFAKLKPNQGSDLIFHIVSKPAVTMTGGNLLYMERRNVGCSS
jgi:hypothetical protein